MRGWAVGASACSSALLLSVLAWQVESSGRSPAPSIDRRSTMGLLVTRTLPVAAARDTLSARALAGLRWMAVLPGAWLVSGIVATLAAAVLNVACAGHLASSSVAGLASSTLLPFIQSSVRIVVGSRIAPRRPYATAVVLTVVSFVVSLFVLAFLADGEAIDGLTERWRREASRPLFVVLGCAFDWLGLAAGLWFVRRDSGMPRQRRNR